MAFQALDRFMRELRDEIQTPSTSRTEEEDDSDNESDIEVPVVSFDSDLDSDDENQDEEREPTEWSDQFKQVHVNPFTELNGPIHDLPDTSTPIDYFSLFVNHDMITHMVEQTNLFAEQEQAQKGKDAYWKPVNEDDMRKFIYINMIFGIISLPEIRLYWSQDPVWRVSAVADMMGRQRYQKMNQYIHLNDSTAQPAKGDANYDPLYKIRPLLDLVRSKCSQVYMPGPNLAVDEAMIDFNGRLAFKQYIPSKPTPYGIKVWCLAESGTGYLLNFQFYIGKVPEQMNNGLGYHVVMQLCSNYLDKNHWVCFDNFFSSIPLAEALLARNTYSCATMRPNRKGWPFRGVKKDKKGSLRMKQKGNLVAVRWTDKREVNVLSTSVPAETVEVQRNSKDGPKQIRIPRSVQAYNERMGGVDLADQFRSYYKIGRKGRKWWRYGMWFLFQVSTINAFILMKRANPHARRDTPAKSLLQFRMTLCKELIHGVSTRQQPNPEQPSVAGAANPLSKEHNCDRIPGRKKRCFQCAADGRKAVSGRAIETVYGCLYCKVHLHKGHCYGKFHEHLQ